MSDSRNTTHRSNLDDNLKKKESQGKVPGDQPAHPEKGRENGSFPNETDSPEAQEPVDPVTDTVPGTDDEPDR